MIRLNRTLFNQCLTYIQQDKPVAILNQLLEGQPTLAMAVFAESMQEAGYNKTIPYVEAYIGEVEWYEVKDKDASHHAVPSGNFQAAQAAASAVITVHVDDTIRLRAKDQSSKDKLRLYGEWWKVKSGYRKGASWMLQSIAKQPREMPAKHVEVLVMEKDGDMHFDVIDCCAFPKEFDYREYMKG